MRFAENSRDIYKDGGGMGKETKRKKPLKGRKLRLKNDEREWEYSGFEHGRILLMDPPFNVTLMVRKEDIDWISSARTEV